MARFYGTIVGSAKTAASRLGHRDIGAHVRGWDVGVEISGCISPSDRDEFYVYATGGSNGSAASLQLGKVTRDGDRVKFTPAPHVVREILLAAGIESLPGAKYTFDSRELDPMIGRVNFDPVRGA
jgi:hypothetical protein